MTTTRERLLAAAWDQVREHGVAGATSRRITERADANLAAITYHFGSKEDLLAEALVDAVRRWLEPVVATLGDPDLDPPSRVARAVQDLHDALDDLGDDKLAVIEALVASQRLPGLGSSVARLLEDLRRLLADEMERQQGTGDLPDWVEPPAMGTAILALAQGLVLEAAIDPGAPPHREVGQQFVMLLLAARPDDDPA